MVVAQVQKNGALVVREVGSGSAEEPDAWNYPESSNYSEPRESSVIRRAAIPYPPPVQHFDSSLDTNG